MENQTDSSLLFEQRVQSLFNILFKNKLTGKAYAIRLISFLGLSFIITSLIGSTVTGQVSNMMYAEPSSLNLLYRFAPLMSFFIGVVGVLSFIFTTSLSIRRVSDIVPDSALWPYAFTVIVVSFIPLINYALFLGLIVIPSNYLTQEKRQQLLAKIA